MAGPTIIAWGTPEQKERYLSKVRPADEIWCQCFSEPDAGSDVAAPRTRIEDKGAHFLVNGQKVWSSFAHIADFCILVGLGDPDAPRYKNLTYVIADMHAPGVETRPLVQITGHPEFNEIFFTDVKVPKENLLGEVGGGWQVAMTTLLHERGTLGFALSATLDVAVRKLIALAKERTVPDEGAARRARLDGDPPVRRLHVPRCRRVVRRARPRALRRLVRRGRDRRRSHEAPRRLCARSRRHRVEGERDGDRLRLGARAVRQEDRHVPGGRALGRRRVRGGRALALA